MASAKICKYIIHFKEKHRKQQAQIITLLKYSWLVFMGVYAPFSMQENPGKRKQPDFFKCERHSVHKPYVSIERQISSVCSWVTKVEAFYFLTFVAAVFLEQYMKEQRSAGSCAQRRSTKAKLSCVECVEENLMAFLCDNVFRHWSFIYLNGWNDVTIKTFKKWLRKSCSHIV